MYNGWARPCPQWLGLQLVLPILPLFLNACSWKLHKETITTAAGPAAPTPFILLLLHRLTELQGELRAHLKAPAPRRQTQRTPQNTNLQRVGLQLALPFFPLPLHCLRQLRRLLHLVGVDHAFHQPQLPLLLLTPATPTLGAPLCSSLALGLPDCLLQRLRGDGVGPCLGQALIYELCECSRLLLAVT